MSLLIVGGLGIIAVVVLLMTSTFFAVALLIVGGLGIIAVVVLLIIKKPWKKPKESEKSEKIK